MYHKRPITAQHNGKDDRNDDEGARDLSDDGRQNDRTAGGAYYLYIILLYRKIIRAEYVVTDQQSRLICLWVYKSNYYIYLFPPIVKLFKNSKLLYSISKHRRNGAEVLNTKKPADLYRQRV